MHHSMLRRAHFCALYITLFCQLVCIPQPCGAEAGVCDPSSAPPAVRSGSQASVFLSHAGEQKKIFVDILYHALTYERIPVFLDEYSLVPGTPGSWERIVEALEAAAVGVARQALRSA